MINKHSMRLFYYISLLFFLTNDSYSYTISRGKFIRNNIIHFSLNKDKLISTFDNRNALVISYDKIGRKVLDDLSNINVRTSVTTTKPKRFNELSSIADEVVIIPQMEMGKDEVMQEAICNNDFIIIADTISIFSIHTFVRTCKRIANAIINHYSFDKKNKNNKKTIILISNINVYGIHTDGKIVNELSNINDDNNDNNYNDNDNKHWQINHLAISKLMRIGENYLLELMNTGNTKNKVRTVILRTSTIIDKNSIIDIKKRDFELRNYTKEIGNTYMSISLTEEIGNCIKWIINNNEVKGVFNLVSNSYKRKCFYDRLFDIINKKRIDWIDDNYLNKDYYYSMDENPLLPNSQRFNMKVDYYKILKNGYKFKYKDIWKYDFE